MIGPRIFSVGDVIYGAGGNTHQDIVDMDEARSALIRIKAEGGPGAISYKNYNIPSRFVPGPSVDQCIESLQSVPTAIAARSAELEYAVRS